MAWVALSVDGIPVGDHVPVVAPLVPQDPTEQLGIRRAGSAVDPIVGAHDGPSTALLYGHPERQAIELAPGAGVDQVVGAAPVSLVVLRGEVLRRRDRLRRLDAPDDGRADLAAQVRLLAAALRTPAISRIAGDIQAGTEHLVAALRPGLFAQGLADLGHEIAIPGRSHGHVHRERGGLALPDPVRPIGKPEPRDAQPEVVRRVHPVAPMELLDLLCQRHLGRSAPEPDPPAATA